MKRNNKNINNYDDNVHRVGKKDLKYPLSVKEDQRLYMQLISYYNASYRKYAGRNTWFRPAWTE